MFNFKFSFLTLISIFFLSACTVPNNSYKQFGTEMIENSSCYSGDKNVKIQLKENRRQVEISGIKGKLTCSIPVEKNVLNNNLICFEPSVASSYSKTFEQIDFHRYELEVSSGELICEIL